MTQQLGNAAAFEVLTEQQAAIYIGMSVAYLRRDRVAGQLGNRTPGPRWMKYGRLVRYRRSDLDAWLAARPMPTNAERAAAR